MAHADAAERAAYLASLSPGADLDLRGTTIDDSLLRSILFAVIDPATQRPTVGDADFSSATFTGDSVFSSVTFTRNAWFDSATFVGEARFNFAVFDGGAQFAGATFNGHAGFASAAFNYTAVFTGATWHAGAQFDLATFARLARFSSATFGGGTRFGKAIFNGHARFDSATFSGPTRFDEATFNAPTRFDSVSFAGEALFRSAIFNGDARFDSAAFTDGARFNAAVFDGVARFAATTFDGQARFDSVTFAGPAVFGLATFSSRAQFSSTVFKTTSRFGPMVCAEMVVLAGVSFESAVTLEVAAKAVSFRRTRWAQPATVWLRYAEADLTDAIAECPVTIAARPGFFRSLAGRRVNETLLAGLPTDQVRVTSLRGADGAQLVMTDIDLSCCVFAGTVHLDQLRLEGDCRFAEPPTGIHRRRGRLLPTWTWYTRRAMLAEEHHWHRSRPHAILGWQLVGDLEQDPQPRALATVYRALRKSYEDSSNEPGAADFYYGEMEMRRASTKRAEHLLLTLYWGVSGYGLRALRALGWLVLAMTATVALMMLWGLPRHETPSLSSGTLAGNRITMTTDSPDPQNPTGPLADRLTSARFDRSLRVVFNSAIFRSSGQDLTTFGTYTEMASRLTEPVLVGLAVLAVRGRIKR